MENQTKFRTRGPARSNITLAGVVLLLLTFGTLPAAAQERLMFPATENAQAEILKRIRAESVRLDIGMWLLGDGEITQAIIAKHKAGVTVRVLGDRASIFESDPNTRMRFTELANAGVPIRLRYNPTWFPEILHWKTGIFVGQGSVVFGSANWTTFELVPVSSTNFKDETALFTDDPDLVQAFMTRFDRFWVDTTYFKDWPEAYQLETGQPWTVPMSISRTRLVVPDFPDSPPGMVWGQGSELNDPLIAEINSESGPNGRIDLVSYRLTVFNVTDAIIARHRAGVPVRIFIEPSQYRNPGFPEYWLVAAMADRMWAAGIPIKQRTHQGLTHMKSLVTSDTAVIASSNFTKFWERDHNYFIPSSVKPALYFAMKDRFEAMWNDTSNYTTFRPLPPNSVTLNAPASGATNVATPVTLEWKRAPWAIFFDVYIGTSPGSMSLAGTVNAAVNESPPETYSFTPTNLQPGTTYYWRVVSRTYATAVDPSLTATSSTRTFTTAGSGGGDPDPGGGSSGPFGGTPVSLPGTIQAENFDLGANGVAYSDTTAGNSGGQYRSTDVDIQPTSDGGGGYNVGWTAAGEWLKYTVNVTTAGTYSLEFRVAARAQGATFHLEVNGADKTGPLTVPNTGDYQSWTTVTKTGVSLAAGQQVWRLVIDSAGPTGVVGNFNYIRATASGGGGPDPDPDPGTSTPFGGTPVSLPGTIQAENFDEGASGVAYSDTTSGNSGGQYRSTDVDIEASSEGGYNIGWTAVGEWLKYTVNVTAAGTYTLEFRVAARAPGARFHLEVNGADKTGPLTIPNTGSYQTWTTVTKTGVSLAAGQQVWRLVFDASGEVMGNINYIRVTSGSTGGGTSAPFSGTPAAVPGTIEAENFDNGGEGVAYHDLTSLNEGGQYRSTGVDLETSLDTSGGYSIGYALSGEWLKYTVNVATAGTYNLDVRVASNGQGGTFHIEVNGVDKTGPIAIPNTSGWWNWTTIRRTGITLGAGQQVVRLVMDSNGSTGFVGNINWLRLTQ